MMVFANHPLHNQNLDLFIRNNTKRYSTESASNHDNDGCSVSKWVVVEL